MDTAGVYYFMISIVMRLMLFWIFFGIPGNFSYLSGGFRHSALIPSSVQLKGQEAEWSNPQFKYGKLPACVPINRKACVLYSVPMDYSTVSILSYNFGLESR